jgi:hypothetical protein
MANLTIRVEKKDVNTSRLGDNFMVSCDNDIAIVFSKEAIEELVADYQNMVTLSPEEEDLLNRSFCTTVLSTTRVKTALTSDQFREVMLRKKPSEIYDPSYSEKTPCWRITEYSSRIHYEEIVFYVADAWADKTPKQISLEELYNQIQCLENCYFI